MPETPDSSQLGFNLDDDAWLSQAREALQPQSWDNLGAYQIHEEVSRGGQGVVLRATNEAGQMVAIKRLLGGSLTGTHGRLRFEREMEIAARLDHPNIVPLLSREIIDRQPLLVMPWIEGQQPDHWAHPSNGPARSRREILQLLCLICDAVSHAHQRGVIHRDLKPSNILVDAQGQPHVLDFGIGKLLLEDSSQAQDLTRTSEFVGSPTYAPPERLLGTTAPADVRDDVYSLGVLLYGLLARAEPYPFGDTLASAIRALQENEPTPIRRYAPKLERDLAVVVHKAIAKNPAHRYRSVESFQADLQRFVNGEAVLAHPPSRIYGLRKFIQRNPLTTALASFSAVLIVGFGFYAQLQAQRLEVERNDAVEARGVAAAEAERTHDALGFLIEEVLAQLDPELRGRAASVPEILRDASSDLATRFGTDPDLELEVRLAIGRLQLLNGDYTGASIQLERAAVLLPLAQKPGPLRAQELQLDLALLRADADYHRAKYAVAEQHLALAESLLTAQALASDKQRLTHLRIRLSIANRQMAAAEAICRTALAEAQSLPDRETAQNHGWKYELLLVYILRKSGKASEAATLAETMIATAKQRYPDQPHLDIADATREWGWSLFYAGQLHSAEAPLREALALRRKLLGPMHPDVAQSLMDVATWSQLFRVDPQIIRGQFEEAVLILRTSGSGQQQLIASAWTSLAGLAADAGELDRAEALYEEALQLLAKHLGERHPLLAGFHVDRGMLQSQRQQFDLARTSFAQASLLSSRQDGSASHTDSASLLMAMARNEDAAGERQEAANYFRRAADILKVEVPAGCLPLVYCLNSLTRIHEELNQPQAAQLTREESVLWTAKISPERITGE